MLTSRQGARKLLEGLHELNHLQDVKTFGFDLYYDIAFRQKKLAEIERLVETRAFRQLEAVLESQGRKVPSSTRALHERYLNDWKR